MDSIMKERPILFNAPMVNAILAGNKTQTRRFVADWQQPKPRSEDGYMAVAQRHSRYGFAVFGKTESECANELVKYGVCPFGTYGDQFWVRETAYAWGRWQTRYSAKKGRDEWHFVDMTLECKKAYLYSLDGQPPQYIGGMRDGGVFPKWWKRPSIHTPREASRILLGITAVRVERLQDISEEDAEAEGCERLDSERDERDLSICPQCGGTGLHLSLGGGGGVCEVDCNKCNTYKKRYQHLWSSIYGAESWATNPWVWTIEFKRITP